MTRKKAVLYARVSTDKVEQEQSLEIQEEIIERFCKDKGFNLKKPHYLEQGKSGTNMKKRTEFISMMKDAGLKVVNSGSQDTFFEDNGLLPMFDIIIVKEASRFSRNQTEALAVLKELKSKGVEVYFISTNTSTTDADWEFNLGLYFNLSQTESKNLSTRIKMSKLHNANNGKYAPAIVPYGYKRKYLEDGNKEIVIDENEAPRVKEIFELYKELGGYSIARILNERNILTKKGKLWSNDKVTRLIQNPVYIGSPVVMKSKKINLTDTKRKPTDIKERVTLEDAVKPIIPIKEFNAIQNIRISRTTTNLKDGSKQIGKHKSKNDIFADKLFCSKCGAKFVRHIGDGKKVNYMCQTRRVHGKDKCNSKGIAFNLLSQGLCDSRLRFNDIGNSSQLNLLNHGIAKLIEKNTEIKESLNHEIDKIKQEELNTFSFMMNLDKFSRAYEIANENIETLNMKRLDIEEQISLVKEESIQRFIAKVELKQEAINEARKVALSEQEIKLLQLQKIIIDDEWVNYYYSVSSFDEEIEEFNRIFGDLVEQVSYRKDVLNEESFQRGFRRLITREEEQEKMNEMCEAMEDLANN